MSRWFRHYAGMARDDKLVRVSIKSKQPVERVVWIWTAVLESAAEIDDDGKFEVEAEEIARFLRCPATKVRAVLDGLTELGRIAEGRVTKWSARQFKSDRSNARVADYRERKRNGGNADVTLQERHRNSPELETERETEEEGSVAKATGVPPPDPDTKFWADAKAYLANSGVRNPGAIVGKMVRDHGKAETARVISRAQIERAVEPVSFMAACFRETSREAADVTLC